MPLAYVPAGQVPTLYKQESDPSVLYEPVAQGVQEDEEEAPVLGEYVPAAQGVHLFETALFLLQLPEGQLVHNDAPLLGV